MLLVGGPIVWNDSLSVAGALLWQHAHWAIAGLAFAASTLTLRATVFSGGAAHERSQARLSLMASTPAGKELSSAFSLIDTVP